MRSWCAATIVEEIYKLKDIRSIEKIGSVYYLITDNYGQELINNLNKLGAEFIENIGLTLEEIFIYTNKEIDRSERDE